MDSKIYASNIRIKNWILKEDGLLYTLRVHFFIVLYYLIITDYDQIIQSF
jgi:hypothetical protein